ncbi:uncharacterized protein LOC143029577 [Oratosquilla oratoria]|uniref:uncharacterized protein LOC143029577 n=1 Tax=Oratosquilla oratoria TaxID=337810 RepID=UPI003F75F205
MQVLRRHSSPFISLRENAKVPKNVVSVACLRDLLNHLASVKSNEKVNKAMGNTTSEQQNGTQIKRTLSQSPSKKLLTKTCSQDDASPESLIQLTKILVIKSLAEDNLDGISKNVFLKYVCNENKTLGNRLFHYIMASSRKEEPPGQAGQSDRVFNDLLSPSAFLASSNHLFSLLSDSAQLEFYIKVFSEDVTTITQAETYDLVFAAYQMAQLVQNTSCLPDDILSAVVRAALHGKDAISQKYLHSWVSQHCPRLVMWMHRYVTHILTVGHRTIPTNTKEEENDTDTPVLEEHSKSSCVTLHPALVWLLACSLPQVFTRPQKQQGLPHSSSLLLDPHHFIEKMIAALSPTHWIPLYNSDNHGLSINRFQHHVFSYHGPTLMFITAEDGRMFCVCSDLEWKDSKHFWGGDDCRCLQLTPEYKVVESGPKLIYFNTTSRGFPLGLQVGTDSKSRALTLDVNLSLIKYRNIPYKLKSFEVWGCGTTEAREFQMEAKTRERREAEKCRRVNLNTVEWKDNPDRYLLELAGGRPNYAHYDKKTQDSGTSS